MKAAFLIGASQFEVRDVPAPNLPPDGILLKVVTCGICGSDLRRWKEGPYPGSDRLVPGHEAAGIIEAVGAEVKDFRLGERLAIAPDVHCGTCYYCQRGLYNLCDDLRFLGITPDYSGGFAEKMVLTGQVLENGIVHRMLEGMSFPQASFAEPCSSVLASHDKAGTSLRDTVLVMGAGPIGCLHIVIAKARGARVILSEPSEIRRNLAQRFGPDLVIDPSSESVVKRVRQFTGGLGADIAICANPIAATQAEAVEAVRKAGRVILFGGLPKADQLTLMNGNLIHYGEITVIGAFSYHPTYHQQAIEAIGRGLIPADHFITHTFALEHINEAFYAAAGGQALKVMIEIQQKN
jgi:L-iditol 2-dehydrogenase